MQQDHLCTLVNLADPILGLTVWCHLLITLGIELNLDFNLQLAAASVFDTGGQFGEVKSVHRLVFSPTFTSAHFSFFLPSLFFC